MNENTIIKEVIVEAPVSLVWKAITDKSAMKKWYFDMDDFKPEVGFEFSFEGCKDETRYVHLCRITEVILNQKLSYTWKYEGYEGSSHVTFELFGEGDNTRVKLTHEGLENFPQENPDFVRENFVAGWNGIIGKSLKQYLENTILEIKTKIQIQKTPDEVFEAIADPSKMSGYFIEKSSGRMEAETILMWKFPEFDNEEKIRTGKIEKDKYISFYWMMGENELLVEISLSAIDSGSTLVEVTEKSMKNNVQGINWLKGNTEGWANFLACLKAYLEYGINLRKGAFDFLRK